VGSGALAKARRREPVAATKRAREVRRMAVADELRDVAHGDRRLLGQQLGGRGHASRAQVLVKARLTELRVRALHLARRAGDRAGDRCERQPAAVVARDDHAREQVQPSSAGERLRLHLPHSDLARRRGTRRVAPAPRRARAAACRAVTSLRRGAAPRVHIVSSVRRRAQA
jgi:hypothetical protein